MLILILGVVLCVVGILGLFHLIALTLPIAVAVSIIGVLAIVFSHER